MTLSIQRFLKRLPHNYPQHNELSQQLYRIEAGYAGELKVDKIIKELNPNTLFFTGPDISLAIHRNYFIQIDTLIITPSYALILEVKNIPGILRFNEHPAYLEREKEDGTIDVFDCPLVQLERNKRGLKKWLTKRGFHIPVIGQVVMASSRSAVKSITKETPILSFKQLPSYIESLDSSETFLSKDELVALIKELKREDYPYIPQPLSEMHSIHLSHLKKGVLCQTCNDNIKRKTQRVWFCDSCSRKENDPYLSALQDWFLLIKPTITNEECREFLNLKDKHAANYLLNSLNLVKEGKMRATKYRWQPRSGLKRKK